MNYSHCAAHSPHPSISVHLYAGPRAVGQTLIRLCEAPGAYSAPVDLGGLFSGGGA